MQEGDDRLDAAFEAFLAFKPSSNPVNSYTYPKLTSPLTFYDKHLDQRLSLRKLSLAPSLTSNLSEAARFAFTATKDDGTEQLPPVDEDFPILKAAKISNDSLPADANLVGRKYQMETSFSVSVMASMLSLHPSSPTWTESLLLKVCRPPRAYVYSALNESYVLEFLKPYTPGGGPPSSMIEKEAWNAMEMDTQEEVSKARERFRFLAVWQMFYIRREARRALKRMNSLLVLDPFPSPSCRTLTQTCVPSDGDLPLSPDAIGTAWGVSVATFADSGTTPLAGNATSTSISPDFIRRSARISAKVGNIVHRMIPPLQSRNSEKHVDTKSPASRNTSDPQHFGHWTEVTIPSRAESTCNDEDMARLIVQHAWSRAVERDSTFIILHCGTYERIAFRHRSSGTLLLSDLIEVETCSNPAYGAIHVGLYISIIKDVLDRARQLIDAEAKVHPKKRKRQFVNTAGTRKRPKTRATVALAEKQRIANEANFNAVCTEITQRQLALIRIQHSHYNSSVPASFLRYRRAKNEKTVYKPEEYFCITLTASLGVGGTGDAHEGFIDLMGPEENTLSLSNIVVKFAFQSDERRRLRHEFKVYEHLKASRVTGIPHHFGLFKDVEGDTLALVMTKAGTPLPNRKPQPPPDEYDPFFSVSKSERDDFIKVLQSIHAAGVRHRDIRAPNLVVNDHGVVSIIDFDRATLNSREETMQREMNHLLSTLDGEDFTGTGLEFVSRGSYQESGAESRGSGNFETWENTDEDSERANGKGDSDESDWEIPDIPLLAFLKHVKEFNEDEESGEEGSDKSQMTASTGGEESGEVGSDDSEKTISEGCEDSEDDGVSE
ncbi:hypothetical protein H0H87_002331 [Tephrocybe sp. NHM501043]|nr:hypothetical protein H0H87_002331 [Tephrocybe sp. NHM501043]